MNTENADGRNAPSLTFVSETKVKIALTLEGAEADRLMKWAEENVAWQIRSMEGDAKQIARCLRAEQRRLASQLLVEAIAACIAFGGNQNGFGADNDVGVRMGIAPRLEVNPLEDSRRVVMLRARWLLDASRKDFRN